MVNKPLGQYLLPVCIHMHRNASADRIYSLCGSGAGGGGGGEGCLSVISQGFIMLSNTGDIIQGYTCIVHSIFLQLINACLLPFLIVTTLSRYKLLLMRINVPDSEHTLKASRKENIFYFHV